MATRTSPPVESRSRKPSGCFQTCLIATAVLAILAIVSAAGVFLLGRAYLERQLPVWEAQYPVVGLAADLFRLKEDLAPTGVGVAPAEGGSLATGERLAGVNDKHQMPDDVSLYSDPLVETYSVGVDEAVGFQRVDIQPGQVEEHLREQMAANGWELAREQDTAWGRLLVWEKGQRTCQMEVVGSNTYTEIWIRYTDGVAHG